MSSFYYAGDFAVTSKKYAGEEAKQHIKDDISDLSDHYLSAKTNYASHYIVLIQDYFSDSTRDGRIAKYEVMREAEYVLKNVFGYNPDQIKAIYDQEYQKTYGHKCKESA